MDIPSKLFGFYRALVVGNKDLEFKGRITVWIPQIMPTIEPDRGLLARPGNNPLGGRNMEGNDEHHYMGTSYIPKRGSWVFVFFEGGNPDNPYYFGSCDLENTKVLPECQKGNNFEDKWVIFKSHEGRTIVVSDDIGSPDDYSKADARIEITGKKRKMKEYSTKPTGDVSKDKDSVYQIDGNQTTILFDERKDKEKILIRTHKGDFLHIDIDERKLQVKFESDINIECGGQLSIKAAKDIHIKTDANYYVESALNTHRTAGKEMMDRSGMKHSTLSDTHITRDAPRIDDNYQQTSKAQPSNPIKPIGERNT